MNKAHQRCTLQWTALGAGLLLLAGCASLPSGGTAFKTPWSKDRENEWQTRKDSLFAEKVTEKRIRRSVMTWFGQGPNQEIARKAYDEGQTLFKDERYADAAWKFRKAIRRWPESALEEDAQFWLGECYFFDDRYAAANGAYNELVKKYPNTQHLSVVSDRRFNLGDFWQSKNKELGWVRYVPNFIDKKRPGFDTHNMALKNYQYILESDSIGPLADDSVMRLAHAYFANGQFDDAADYYEMLRTQYPQSTHLFDAYRFGVQTELRRYQGPEYTGTPLERAEVLLEEMAVMFPDKLQEQPDEMERLQHTKELVQVSKAERDLELAQFYDRSGHWGAARRYYEEVKEVHAGTPVASTADQRLTEIADKPTHAPNVVTRLASLWSEEDSDASSGNSADQATSPDGTQSPAAPSDKSGEPRKPTTNGTLLR